MSRVVQLTAAQPQQHFAPHELQAGRAEIRTYWESRSTPRDLDQAVAYRTKQGHCGIIRAGEIGSLTAPPYMMLSGDDQAGGVGEIVYGDIRTMWQGLTWLGVAVYDTNPLGRLGTVEHLSMSVQFPGLPSVEVRVRDVASNICTGMQVSIGPAGIHVTLDHSPLATDDYYLTPVEVLAAYWHCRLWGSGK